MPDLEKVAEHIRETAQAEILPRFRLLRREDIREKGPGDFVTLADLEAERQLTQRLDGLLPGSVVLGEEAASQDGGRFALLAGEAPVWVIDPVDGTANFARGQPGFAVIVALIERAVKQAEAQTEIGKSAPAWSGHCGAAARNAEIHAEHHQRRDEGGVPKNPVPGKMVGIPTLERRGDVAREYDVRGVGGDAENNEAFWERRQDEGHGE